MLYKEISSFDIHNNPSRVNSIVTDNANHFANDLYILSDGNNFQFDSYSLQALKTLSENIQIILLDKAHLL